MPANFRRLPFADVQIGSALVNNDVEEFIYVGHLAKGEG
jgi:hypothetical protein